MKRILLVEDDPASREYLIQALALIGLEVQACADLAEARTALSQQRFDAILSDANLPDGGAESLFDGISMQSRPALCIAMSAALSAQRRETLREAGFHPILIKPLGLDALRSLFEHRESTLPLGDDRELESARNEQSLWDEAQALRALGGNRQAFETLRGMFLAELAGQRERILNAIGAGEVESAQAILHQLQSSARLLGAKMLRETVDALKDDPADPTRRTAFDFACKALLTRND